MRTSLSKYYDAMSRRTRYGVMIQIEYTDGKRAWVRVASNGKPELYDTAEEAQSRRAELRKQPMHRGVQRAT